MKQFTNAPETEEEKIKKERDEKRLLAILGLIFCGVAFIPVIVIYKGAKIYKKKKEEKKAAREAEKNQANVVSPPDYTETAPQ